MLRLLKYCWIPFVIALIIFYACCLISPSNVPDMGFEFFIPGDKLAHYLMYLGFSGATALYYIYDKKGVSINMPLMFIGAVIVPILYGGLIEIVQYRFFPLRSGDWFDFLADVLGTLTAIPVIFYFRAFLLKKQTQKTSRK